MAINEHGSSASGNAENKNKKYYSNSGDKGNMKENGNGNNGGKGSEGKYYSVEEEKLEFDKKIVHYQMK